MTNPSVIDSDEELLRAAASELRHGAPEPLPWGSLRASPVAAPESESRWSWLLAAAASIVMILVVGALVIVVPGVGGDDADRPADDPTTSTGLAGDDRLPPTRPVGTPWSPVIEQPVLTDDVDAIEVSADPADWVGRSLFPAVTPEEFTIASVSTMGAAEELGWDGAGWRDLMVSYLPIEPRNTSVDPRLHIETMPGGIVGFEGDQTVTTTVDWMIHTSVDRFGLVSAYAAPVMDDVKGMVFLYGAETEAELITQLTSLLESLRLVATDEIPVEVIHFDDLPVVAVTRPQDPLAGIFRASPATNGWCISTRHDDKGAWGCDFGVVVERSGPTSSPTDGDSPGPAWPAILVEFTRSRDGRIAFAGISDPEVASIELEFIDGHTVTLHPTMVDGTGFWIGSHWLDREAHQGDPLVEARALDEAGAVLGLIPKP